MENEHFSAIQGQLMALEALLTEVIKTIPPENRGRLYQDAKVLALQSMAHNPSNKSASQTLARVQRLAP